MNTLSAFFHATGYLRVPALLPADQVDRLNDAAEDVVGSAGSNVTAGWRTRIDRVSVDPAYDAVATSERLVAVLRPVLGMDIELVENRHNHVSVYPGQSIDRCRYPTRSR